MLIYDNNRSNPSKLAIPSRSNMMYDPYTSKLEDTSPETGRPIAIPLRRKTSSSPVQNTPSDYDRLTGYGDGVGDCNGCLCTDRIEALSTQLESKGHCDLQGRTVIPRCSMSPVDKIEREERDFYESVPTLWNSEHDHCRFIAPSGPELHQAHGLSLIWSKLDRNLITNGITSLI